MRAPNLLDSASGLRPLSAFLVVATVLTLVAGRSVWLVLRDAQGSTLDERVSKSRQTECDQPPALSILDADGRPLALSEVRLDLILSPNAMWQAHTPRKMARLISGALGGTPGENELLAQMLPDAENGWIRARNVRSGEPLVLTDSEARRVLDWAAAATFDERGNPQPIEGLWVEPGPRGWVLCWEPAKVLDEDMREVHVPSRRKSPLVWSRFLADGLARCLLGDDALAPGPGVDEGELRKQREAIWQALMPTTWATAVRDFDANRAAALAEVLEQQHVAYRQMRIERDCKRTYPAGRDALLGFWGYVGPEQARRGALAELGFERAALAEAGALERAEGSFDSDQRERYQRLLSEWIARPHPLTGLERACDRLLSQPRWAFLQREPATFTFLQHSAVALRPGSGGLRTYFESSTEASEAPRVVTTLDWLLQRYVDAQLGRVVAEHAAAVAMAIVLEVDSGAVLAVGSRSPYELAGWAPVFHQFLPGSTFKVPVMAIALDTGAVQPNTQLDVGDGSGFRLPGRTIYEAELSRQTGVLSAAECLAHSVNAGLVQIGLRVPPETLRGRLRALHYSEKPDTGLGGERPGSLPRLPWKTSWEHASVSFGYETFVTLWQHAAALATVVRGGQYKPLRLLDAVEQGGRRWEISAAEVEPVFSARTCAQMRDMMHTGAAIGTGKSVIGPDRVERLGMGSKTGTAERVGSEVCVHVELAHQQRHARSGTGCPPRCFASLRAAAREHTGACKTLSMAVFGRRPSDGREVLVLVVVDEPTRGARYGSDTAGPAAVSILEEALGVTAFGEPRGVQRIAGFRRGRTAPQPSSEQPWAEVGR